MVDRRCKSPEVELERRRKISESMKKRIAVHGNNNKRFGASGSENYFFGKSHTDETKEKNRQAHIGKEQSPAVKRLKSIKSKEMWRSRSCEIISLVGSKISVAKKGKSFSKEHKRALSEARIRYCQRFLSSAARDGYTRAFSNKLKELIRERDGFKCKYCGRTQSENGQALSVHHIDYDKTNSDPRNLVSLCASCHAKTSAGNSASKRRWTHIFKETNLMEVGNYAGTQTGAQGRQPCDALISGPLYGDV